MPDIPHIRPLSDLRSNISDISREAHESNEPIFLTKNGRGDMVLMSLDAYEQGLYESEAYLKLKNPGTPAPAGPAKRSNQYNDSPAVARLKKIITKAAAQ
jgi:prevent-host-death family protein